MADLSEGSAEAPDPSLVEVDFEPIGRRVQISRGTDLLAVAQKAGIDLVAACGGLGICGTCRVRKLSGSFSPATLNEEGEISAEDIRQGWRMACQTYPLSDVRVEIAPESLPSLQRLQVEGQAFEVGLKPNVIPIDLSVEPPSLADLRSDQRRINDALHGRGAGSLAGDPAVWGHASDFLREHNWSARLAVRQGDERSWLAGIYPAGETLLGLAVDIGSTKLAVYLVHLETGVTLAQTGVMNPQIAYGEDVVSRIAFANRAPGNRRLLQERLVHSIHDTVERLCRQVGRDPLQVVDAVLVGNTAIHHFVCGLPVEQLGAAPYLPVISDPIDFFASEIGLQLSPGARVHMPANIAGFVGADHTSALLSVHSGDRKHSRMLIDIGTNTEISLEFQGQILACSCASGPAFEGAHIHDGMRAAPGAIEKVQLTTQGVRVSTIDGKPAVGICGTGILQAVAEMARHEVIDGRGAFRKEHPWVKASPNHQAVFELVPAERTAHGRAVVVTRKDVHEIQLAKAAIRAGIEILLCECFITAEQVDEWVIAGAFGTYLDPQSALWIGMLPQVSLNRIRQVGNAAGQGAKQMLLSLEQRELARKIALGVRYIELTTHPDFTQTYVDAMYL
ncbi:MAG TPA: ASKHA domain-containing protein [Anaerolineaceae bacterium]|nr:ASKHA domain-containing protein [Anaerolineaceae bacterium]